MYLELGDYQIRNWRIEDALSLAKHANNRKIWLNLRDRFPHPYTLRDAESFLEKAISVNSNTYFAIADKSKAIGSIGFTVGKDVHRYTAEMGYWLAEPFWGRGIMTTIVKSLTKYALDDLNLHRIFAEPFSTNRASARVLEKAGFQQEGILRSSVVKDGKVLDQVLYSYIHL